MDNTTIEDTTATESTQQDVTGTMSDGRPSSTKDRSKRQLVEDARRTAMDGHWKDTIAINDEILTRFPVTAEAHNRRGRALVELDRYPEAIEAYQAALKADPANLIARRNLRRLDLLRQGGNGLEDGDAKDPASLALPRTLVFIEEVGKTWHGELVNAVSLSELAVIDPGEQLRVNVDGPRLIVADRHGKRLGEIEVGVAQRVIELMDVGNRYEIYALGLTSVSLRVILREVYRNPSLGTRVSFTGKIKTVRNLERDRDLLRLDDDYLFGDDDEELEDEDASRDGPEDIEPTDPEETGIPFDRLIMDDDEDKDS